MYEYIYIYIYIYRLANVSEVASASPDLPSTAATYTII